MKSLFTNAFDKILKVPLIFSQLNSWLSANNKELHTINDLMISVIHTTNDLSLIVLYSTLLTA